MTPREQTSFGAPDGDAMRAAVASVLDLPIEAVPNFADAREQWWEALVAWATTRDLVLDSGPEGEIPAGAHAVATGEGPRGHRHAVVWADGTMAHDPHPDRTGLAAPPDRFYWFRPFPPGDRAARLRRLLAAWLRGETEAREANRVRDELRAWWEREGAGRDEASAAEFFERAVVALDGRSADAVAAIGRAAAAQERAELADRAADEAIANRDRYEAAVHAAVAALGCGGEQNLHDEAACLEELAACVAAKREDVARSLERLRAAVRRHRDASRHNRCWLNDLELYGALGEAVPADPMPPRDEFLARCALYHDDQARARGVSAPPSWTATTAPDGGVVVEEDDGEP